MDLNKLKVALLLFWAAWFAIVIVTNVLGALKAAGWLPADWRFASKNYEAVVKALSVHRLPRWAATGLFAAVVLWQLAAFLLFTHALLASLSGNTFVPGPADLAFAAGIGLFAAFMIADELTLKFAYEQAHENLLIAQLACLVVVHLS